MKLKLMSMAAMALSALLCLTTTGAWADELTVYDGTTKNDFVPIYGYYCDAYLKCEAVMPASELSAMNGSEISAMTFYASQNNVSWGDTGFQVFLKEVSSTTIGGFSGPGTVVYEGTLSIVDGKMTVTFTTPYTYNGGNLLIGVYITVLAGQYANSNWYGETVSGASVQGHNYSDLESVNPTQRNFLPKTTFTYNAPAPTYTVSLKEGIEDASNWQGKAGEGEYQVLPLEGVAAGMAVSVKYIGTKKVKSVKAVKVKPAATVTTAPTAKTGVKAGQNEAIVNAGTATGGTMMYAVTTDNTQPASTDGFSDTVPTAEGLTAGTYYVWYYVKADDSHTDSEISATGIEVTIAAPAATGHALSASEVGEIVCSDGLAYAAADKDNLPQGVTAVAKICYVSGSNGLALALADEGQMNWSTAISTCAAHTPAFTGGTWKLATKDEWTNMITAAGSYTALRDGFSSVGGSNLQSGTYWTSTERENDSSKAWRFNFANGYWISDVKGDASFRVRACLAF